MDSSQIEELLDRLVEQVLTDPDLRAEWEAEGRRFAAVSGLDGPAGQPDGGAAIRFREYFLLEHRSARYGVIPALTAWESLRRQCGPEAEDHEDMLFGSFVGVFEIRGRTSPALLEAEDLASGRLLVIADGEAADRLEAGDILVGRLFPIDATDHLASPGSAIIRNEDVRAAVQRDIARLREQNVWLRFSQLEFESLFFRRAVPGPGASEGVAKRLEEFLAATGDPELDMGQLTWLAGAADSVGTFLGPLLDKLAFDTTCDLEMARRLLIEFWHEQQEALTERLPGEEPAQATQGPSAQQRAEAVEAFERGRQAGEDLQVLFERLQQALGFEEQTLGLQEEASGSVEDLDSTEPLGLQPIVDEYLWERQREGRPVESEEENLLRDFASRLDQGALRPESVDAMTPDCLREYLYAGLLPWLKSRMGAESRLDLEARIEAIWVHLEAFCRWLEQEQGVLVVDSFRTLRQELASELPRLLRLGEGPPPATRRAAQSWLRLTEPPDLQRATLNVVTLFEPEEELTVRVDTTQAADLKDGDILLAAIPASAGEASCAHLYQVLPAAAGEFLVNLRQRLEESAS